MNDAPIGPAPLPAVEAELLVATFTPEPALAHRNAAWKEVFGAADDPWLRLAGEHRRLTTDRVLEAAAGALITNHLCLVQTTRREEPLPVLMNFLPVYLRDGADASSVGAVNVTGEVLTEPDSWTMNQTQRHRMETLGRMTMGIAHDFNNLLSALLGHVELLKKHVGGRDLEPSFGESLHTIEQVALDGASLVEKIQRYMRKEKETHFEPVDLSVLLEGCITLTRPYWYNEPRRRGIAIEMETALDAVPLVQGAEAELREVFVNLILNAVQALPEGGMITIRTSADEHRGVRASIADDGEGMSEAVQKRIFEPMFSTKGSQGSGMGLTVSYGIIQEHDGEIEVRSTPSRGTRFDMYFPPTPEQQAAEEAEEEQWSAQPARVLIVDDEQRVRSVFSRLLSLKGHHVKEAASGAEALALIEQASFDIIFTDHGMPAMDGTQLARILRGRFPSLPIVLLTGDTDVSRVEEIDLLMGKPFKLSDMEATIRQLVH